jgi:hypothetical protein
MKRKNGCASELRTGTDAKESNGNLPSCAIPLPHHFPADTYVSHEKSQNSLHSDRWSNPGRTEHETEEVSTHRKVSLYFVGFFMESEKEIRPV